MNILITGCLSHLGVNFILKYNLKFNIIIGIDKISYCSNSIKILENCSNFIFIKDDVRNLDLISILNKYNIYSIFNMSASTHIDRSYTHFNEYIENNIYLVHHILEAMRNSLRSIKLIHISTDEIYGGDLNKIFSETDNSNPTNPYAASKVASEALINSYVYSFNLNCLIFRPNNLFGMYQYKEKVIPKFIYNIINNNQIEIHGDGNQIRDFVSTNEVNRVIYEAYLKDLKGIYNIGIENRITILELSNYIFNFLNKMNLTKLKKNNFYTFVKDRPYNDKRYLISSLKLNSENIFIYNKWNDEIDDIICYYINEFKK